MRKKDTIFKLIMIAIGVLIIISIAAGNSYDPIKFYNRTAQVSGLKKMFIDTFLVTTTGDAFTVNISSAGFSHVFSAAAIPMRNTSTLTQIAVSNLKSISTTSAVFNIVQPTSTSVTILGISVLSSAGFEFVAANTVTLQIIILGD